MKKLFTERHGGAKPRTAEELDVTTRDALLNLIAARIEDDWFGLSCPEKCPDGYPYAGTDHARLRRTLAGFGLPWPSDVLETARTGEVSERSDGEIFDLLEFSYEHIALPTGGSFHSYFSHRHLSFDQEAGREQFTVDVNRLFERNGIAFELREGEVIRTGPAVLDEALAAAVFSTGDSHLDEMLEDARTKFLNRDLKVRREALEKLWDAWERLKTLDDADKKKGAKSLLDRAAAEAEIRARLETEAAALTKIGNDFMIRHSETTKIPVSDSAHVDYLFHRMFALTRLLLKASGRGG